MLKILITGGTGRLAAELKQYLTGDYVGVEHFDFIYGVPKGEYDLVIHAGAYTDVVKAETERVKCMLTNVMGTFNMVDAYKDTPFVYISTEYAKNPLGVYAWSKRIGEEIVKEHPRHLILRTAFKPKVWPFLFAYEDQYTQGDYVDVIAELLSKTVREWDFKSDYRYLGTGRKTMLELARRTRPDVQANKVKDYKYAHLIPKDYE